MIFRNIRLCDQNPNPAAVSIPPQVVALLILNRTIVE